MASSTSPTVTIVGHVTHDYYGDRTVPGGCAFYGARVYHALGARVRLLTSWGEDFACAEALADLESVQHEVGGGTTTFVNRYRADATRSQELRAQAPALSPDRLDERPTDVLHLAPVLDEVDLGRFMPRVRALKAKGLVGRVALSVQGFARAKRPSGDVYLIEHVPWRPAPEQLDGVDVAFLSDEDLVAQDGLLERLRAGVPRVVLTHGAQGAEVLGPRRRLAEVGVYATQAVDPTGAGDTFAAAFLVSEAMGASVDEALRVAAGAGSIVVEGEGPATLGEIPRARDRAADVSARTL